MTSGKLRCSPRIGAECLRAAPDRGVALSPIEQHLAVAVADREIGNEWCLEWCRTYTYDLLGERSRLVSGPGPCGHGGGPCRLQVDA